MKRVTAGDDPVSHRLDEADFDLELILTGMDDDWDLFREIVGIFAEDAPKLMAEIRDAIGKGDPLRLQCAAHTLQGALSNFYARVPTALALKLELSGGSGEFAGAREGLAALEEEIARLSRALALSAGENGTS
jgi:HPt (histidine-containing phosphotransfer) domain-containing protein